MKEYAHLISESNDELPIILKGIVLRNHLKNYLKYFFENLEKELTTLDEIRNSIIEHSRQEFYEKLLWKYKFKLTQDSFSSKELNLFVRQFVFDKNLETFEQEIKRHLELNLTLFFNFELVTLVAVLQEIRSKQFDISENDTCYYSKRIYFILF